MGWSKDGMAPCLVYSCMEGDNFQDRLVQSRPVPLTDNERILVLSDVARGLTYETLLLPTLEGVYHSP